MPNRLAPQHRKQWYATLQSSRVALGVGVVVLLFFAVSLGREVIRQVEEQRELQQLQREIDTLNARHVELSDLVDVLDTESFREREARTKLGLQRQGEQVVLISRDGEEPIVNGSVERPGVYEERVSNATKWWRYFFHE